MIFFFIHTIHRISTVLYFFFFSRVLPLFSAPFSIISSHFVVRRLTLSTNILYNEQGNYFLWRLLKCLFIFLAGSVWLLLIGSVLLAGPTLWLFLSKTPYPPIRKVDDSLKKRGGEAERRNTNYGLELLCLYMVAPVFAEPVPFFPRFVCIGVWN